MSDMSIEEQMQLDGGHAEGSGGADATGAADPFAPENIGVVNFIVQQRIYDALMAILNLTDKDVAKDLLELHANGHFMGPSPYMSGKFVTDEVKDE